MSDLLGEGFPTISPEQAITSFREDRLAGTGHEGLIDSATIHCVRDGDEDFADITVTSGNIVTIKTEKDGDAIIYWANGDLLLATDETFLPVMVCPPDAIADFVATLTERDTDTERVTLEIDITPEKPTVMQHWADLWDKEGKRPLLQDTEALRAARELDLLTETHYGDYLRSLGHPVLIESMLVPELIFPGAHEHAATMQEWEAGWDRLAERLGQAVNRYRAAQETAGLTTEQYSKTDLRFMSPRVLSWLGPIAYVEIPPPITSTRPRPH